MNNLVKNQIDHLGSATSMDDFLIVTIPVQCKYFNTVVGLVTPPLAQYFDFIQFFSWLIDVWEILDQPLIPKNPGYLKFLHFHALFGKIWQNCPFWVHAPL